MITAGSHSRLSDFETCNRRAELKYIRKIPEPPRPQLEPGKEYPDERGTRIHKEAEEFLKGIREELSDEFRFFKNELIAARELYKLGMAQGETSWQFDENWRPLEDPFATPAVDWALFRKIKFRIKADLVIRDRPLVVVTDYKTGKRYGNELKHGEQMELYAIGAFLLYPDIEEVITELWYLDINDIVSMKFTRQQAYDRLKSWDSRNKVMLTAMTFPPNPNMHNCRWCPYGPSKSNDCDVGVQ